MCIKKGLKSKLHIVALMLWGMNRLSRKEKMERLEKMMRKRWVTADVAFSSFKIVNLEGAVRELRKKGYIVKRGEVERLRVRMGKVRSVMVGRYRIE